MGTITAPSSTAAARFSRRRIPDCILSPRLAATPTLPIKPPSFLPAAPATLPTALPLPPQFAPPPASATAAAPAAPFEPLPTLSASTILQPQYLAGPNFTVRSPVPTYSGSNQYT